MAAAARVEGLGTHLRVAMHDQSTHLRQWELLRLAAFAAGKPQSWTEGDNVDHRSTVADMPDARNCLPAELGFTRSDQWALQGWAA